jgi:type IV pilus assembly protein PilE
MYMHAERSRMALYRGFSLMELMVSITILAILSAIAYPSYTAYVMRANRTDATSALIQAAQGLQRCYSQSGIFSYQNCSVPTSSPNGYYTITPTTLTAPSSTAVSTFVLTAIPAKTPQTRDTQCSSFTINNVGTQTATNSSGTTNTTICWPGN